MGQKPVKIFFRLYSSHDNPSIFFRWGLSATLFFDEISVPGVSLPIPILKYSHKMLNFAENFASNTLISLSVADDSH